MTDKPLIVFVGAVYPSQYSLLCSHLRAQGLADAWFMTTPGHKANHDKHCDHLLSFQPDGLIVGPQSYYYSDKVERSARICRGVLKALEDFEAAQGRKIDVVVAHSLWGAPNWLYGELSAAIISYIEFPSYLAHGWDAAYPPDQAQRLGDRNTEMLSFHQVLCSDLTIVPSAYARAMFPPLLQDRIAVQFEGFDIQPPLRDLGTASDATAQAGDSNKPFTIAFSARDLSSAKGFETYIRLVDRMVREGDGQNTRFIAIGDPKASTYGYEQQWVERRYGGKVESFRDHLLKVYPAADVIEFPGHLPYDQFSALLAEVDLFLYPLRYGVANWGLMEILARGGCVIGSNWGFAPELIAHNVNGLLLPDNDDDWIQAIRQLRKDPARRQRYAQAALETGKAYHIAKVAPRFMALFERALANRKAPLVAPR